MRHVIDPINHRIYSGTWEKGLTCFDYARNRVVWHRSDVIGIQSVSHSAGFPESIIVSLEAPDYLVDEPGVSSGIVELNARDGSTTWRTTAGDRAFTHPCQSLIVMTDRYKKQIYLLDKQREIVGSLPMTYFAVIDVGFSKDMIALAEGKEGVRIIDRKGQVISHYITKNRKTNCIGVAFFNDRLVVFDYAEKSFVTIIDPSTGEVSGEYEYQSYGFICFIDHGSRFVTSSGEICRSIDGKHEIKLKIE